MHTFLDERDRLEIDNRIKKVSSKSIVVGKAGSVVNVTDGANDVLKGLRVFGKTDQKTYSGNQLLNITDKLMVNTDGTIQRISTCYSATIKIENVDDIYISGDFTLLNSGTVRIGLLNEEPTEQSIAVRVAATTSRSINVSGYSYVLISFGVYGLDTTVEQIKNSFMVNKGTTPLPYEPYTGCIPSPNPEYPQELVSAGGDGDVEVMVYGENLIPYPYVKKNYDIVGVAFEETDGKITVNGTPQANYCDYYLYGSNIDSGTYMYFPKGDYNVSLMPINDSFDGFNEFIAFRTLERGAVLNNSAIKRVLKETELHVYGIFVRAGEVGKTYNNVVIQPIVTMLETVNFKDRFEGDNRRLMVPTPNGLPGIPITDASLATYTDENGQMWCSDEVDYERGVYIQRVKDVFLNKNTCVTVYVQQDYCRFHFLTDILFDIDTYTSRTMRIISNKLVYSNAAMYGCYLGTVGDSGWKGKARILVKTPLSIDTIDKFMEYIGEDCVVKCILAEPIETPLSEEEIAAYKALHTNYPNTTILNDSDAHMEVKYTADIKNHIEQNYVSKEAAEALLSRVSNIENHMV